MEAGEAGADYVAFGAFYPTTTKPSHYRPDPSILSWWSTLFEIPCVAIGGITPDNAKPLVDAGADFLAVVQAVWGKDDPAAAVRAFEPGLAVHLPDHRLQRLRVVDGVAVDVVVEIAPDAAARRDCSSDPVGPARAALRPNSGPNICPPPPWKRT